MLTILLGLVLGLIMGYVSQRSRFCIQGGFRDFFLFRNTFLLKGVLAAMAVFALVNIVGYVHAP